MNKSYQKKEPMSAKAKRYWAIGIVLGVIVAALLIWNSGIFQKNATAATVGDQKFSVTDLTYYYNAQINSKNQEVLMNQQFGMESDYDTSLSPREQYYDEANGVTYAEYFLDQALAALRQDTILSTEAKAAGYSLSQAGQDTVDSNLDALHMYSTQQGHSESAYLKLLYGKYMSKSKFVSLLTNSILASEYAREKQASFTYTPDELNSYYEENQNDLDTYSYRYCYISGTAESTVDEDGNTVDPTEEASAAAMEAAKTSADSMVAAVQSGAAFNEAAAAVLDQENAEYYSSDPDYNLAAGILGSDLQSTYRDWLQDEGRQAGDVTSIEASGGYYVVQFISREKDDSSYQTISYRNILILSETTDTEVPVEDTETAGVTTEDGAEVEETETTEPETEIVSLPTDEQLADAKAQAQDLLSQWESGEATSESFGALAQDNSADETNKADGGMNENANRDFLSSDLTEWLFAEGRKAGDTTILDYTDSDGNVIGYQILFVDSLGQIVWEYEATAALQADGYQNWYSKVEENYPAELTDKGKAIAGVSDAAEAETTQAEAETTQAEEETGAEDAEAAETTEEPAEAETTETSEPESKEEPEAEVEEDTAGGNEAEGDSSE